VVAALASNPFDSWTGGSAGGVGAVSPTWADLYPGGYEPAGAANVPNAPIPDEAQFWQGRNPFQQAQQQGGNFWELLNQTLQGWRTMADLSGVGAQAWPDTPSTNQGWGNYFNPHW
jgi:hypothetical protein